MKDLRAMSELELLQTRGAVIAELRRRGVVRTANNPIGDYTEWLVCNRLGLEIQGNNQAAFDAVDPQSGDRYQIKGRRSSGNTVQFSSIRNLETHGFDFVVAVVLTRIIPSASLSGSPTLRFLSWLTTKRTPIVTS